MGNYWNVELPGGSRWITNQAFHVADPYSVSQVTANCACLN